MSLLSSLPEREEKEKRVTSGLRNCVLYPSIFSLVSESVSFVCSFVVFVLFKFEFFSDQVPIIGLPFIARYENAKNKRVYYNHLLKVSQLLRPILVT